MVIQRLALALSLSLIGVAPAAAGPVSVPQVPVKKLQSGNGPAVQRAHPGNIAGVVVNLDGEPVPEANVELVKVGSPHKRYETHSDKDGKFAFNNLEPGEWHLSYAAKGMLAAEQKVTVVSDQTASVKEELEDIEASDVLRVTGQRSLIHPENTGTRTTLDQRTLNEYGSGNDLRQDIETAPGIMRDSVGNIITRGEHNAVNYEIDGVILPETGGSLNQAQFASPRSLESVTVDIGGYQARDGGGPLGAIVRMKSLPIPDKPTFKFGLQGGGPLNGALTYSGAGALSQNSKSILNRLRVESTGTVVGTTRLGVEPPSVRYSGNRRADLNFLTKVEFAATEKDRFKLTVGVNDSFLNWPVRRSSEAAGVGIRETDREDYAILGYRRTGEKWFDEATLNIVNAFYSTKLRSRNVWDPTPVLVGDAPLLVSTAANAVRFNYAFSAQGEVRKRYLESHNVSVGFLSEARPVRTNLSAFYYNNDPSVGPVGALISPFTLTFGGPQYLGNTGNYKGFRYLQSAYIQDAWRPQHGALKRLSIDAGVRVDVYHGVFGNTLRVANLISQIPGIAPFSLAPFEAQRVTNGQVSGRFGGSYAITDTTVVRGSFAQLFQPPPVDLFSAPFQVTRGTVGGIFPGSLRPLEATRGQLVDASIEKQIGPRFAARTNIFYKKLKNFGDSSVVQNTPLYNRLSLSGQEAYGVESRLDLKPARDGYGFNGFVSSTVAVAYLRGTKRTTGGVFDVQEFPSTTNYPDHDRRLALTSGLGYRSPNGVWTLASAQVMTGLKNDLAVEIFGPHPARAPATTNVGFNIGYDLPKALADKNKMMPSSFECRIENLLNQRKPINLGSPFQGQRYMLPLRVLAGMYWHV